MFKTKTITLDFKCENRPPTKANFTYKIGPDAIEIADTGRGRLSVTEDMEAVMRRLEYWHMGSLRTCLRMHRVWWWDDSLSERSDGGAVGAD
jgi:hypothetical protein